MDTWDTLGDLVRVAYDEGRRAERPDPNPYNANSADRVERLQALAWARGRSDSELVS